MSESIDAIVRYERSLETVQGAVELSHGLDPLPANVRVVFGDDIQMV